MNHIPRKRFGQNFLHDQAVIYRLLNLIIPKLGEHFVEIGPGKGALTFPLLEQIGQMDVIEFDRDLVEYLKQHSQPFGELNIHSADILKFDLATLISANKKLRVIGNLPYNISTPLLFRLIEYAQFIQDMHFMLQKEVVERLSANVGCKAYGRLTIMIQYFCHVEPLFLVPPASFSPQPKVDSMMVRLVPFQTLPYVADDYKAFCDIVKYAFSMRRKTLRNALKDKMTVVEIEQAGVDPSLRAESISLAQFVELANIYSCSHQ